MLLLGPSCFCFRCFPIMLQDYGRKPYFTTTLTYYEGYFVSKISRTQYTTLTVWSDTKETFSDYLTNVVTFYLLSMKNQLPMSKFWGLVKILQVLPDFASLDLFWNVLEEQTVNLACFLLCFIVITGHYHLLLWWHQLVFMVRSSVFSCHQSWNTSPSPVFIAPFFSYPQKIRLSRVVQAGKVCSKVPLWWSGMQKRQLDPFILQKYEVVIVLLQLST